MTIQYVQGLYTRIADNFANAFAVVYAVGQSIAEGEALSEGRVRQSL